MRRSSVRLRSGRESTTGGPSVHLNIDNSAAGNRQSLLLFNEQGSYCKPSSTGPIPERNRCHHQDPIVHCCPYATRRCLTHLLTLVLVCRRSRPTSNLTAWSQSATAESSWGQRSQSSLQMYSTSNVASLGTPANDVLEIWRVPLVQLRPG